MLTKQTDSYDQCIDRHDSPQAQLSGLFDALPISHLHYYTKNKHTVSQKIGNTKPQKSVGVK